jgi:Arc/MetJ family transcription regulator
MTSGAGQAVITGRSTPRHAFIHHKVYSRLPVTRTNIEIDDELIARAMRLYRLPSKREAVDLALRRLVGEPMSREEMLAAEGSGWGGDLAEIRSRQEIPEL